MNCSRRKGQSNLVKDGKTFVKDDDKATLATKSCIHPVSRNCEPMYGSVEKTPTRRKSLGGSRHYANFDSFTLKWWFNFIVLAQSFLVFPSASQTTVKTDCPTGCFCVAGEYNSHLMNGLISDGRLIAAWDRLMTYLDGDTIDGALFCRNSTRSAVPQGLAATADVIFLDGNSIAAIEAADFAESSDNVTMKTSSTVAVILSNNRISSVASDWFRWLPRLRLMILRNNSLPYFRCISSDPGTLSSLHELDLSLNGLERLESSDFGRLPRLQRLDLSGNKIATVEQDVLWNFPNLEHLDLSYNSITQMGLVASDTLTSALKYLSVAGNRLGDVGSPRALEFFTKISSLESLDLSQNPAKSGRVPAKAFSGLQNVRTLNLSGCGIRALHQGWLNGGAEKSLEILDLSHNLLLDLSAHDISAVFTVNESVTPMPSSFPDIAEIPEANVEMHWLRSLNRLTALYLNDNYRLKRIQDDAFDFVPNLKYLFLQNCAIRRLNIALVRHRYGMQPVVSSLPALTHIWISGNPISCDCYVRFLKEWTIASTTVIQNQTSSGRYIDAPTYILASETRTLVVDSAICVAPSNLADVAMEAVPAESMVCQEEPYTIFIAMLIGPLMFVGSVVLTLICGSVHVLITRTRKGVVLSYHAREEMMRNPKGRSRQRSHQPTPILSGFGWSRSSSRGDVSTVGLSGQGVRHPNLVLAQLGEHRHRQLGSEVRPHSLSPDATLSHSTTSLNVCHPQHRHSAGYCSGTEAVGAPPRRMAAPTLVVSAFDTDEESPRNKSGGVSDVDSVLGKESVRTRSACSDFPFIDERSHISSLITDQNDPDKRSLKKSSSSDSDGSIFSARQSTNLRQRKDSFTSSNGSHGSTHKIPGIAPSGSGKAY